MSTTRWDVGHQSLQVSFRSCATGSRFGRRLSGVEGDAAECARLTHVEPALIQFDTMGIIQSGDEGLDAITLSIAVRVSFGEEDRVLMWSTDQEIARRCETQDACAPRAFGPERNLETIGGAHAIPDGRLVRDFNSLSEKELAQGRIDRKAFRKHEGTRAHAQEADDQNGSSDAEHVLDPLLRRIVGDIDPGAVGAWALVFRARGKMGSSPQGP